jgi:hypothetical protein
VTAGAEQQPLAPIARDGFYALFSKLSPADLYDVFVCLVCMCLM